MGNPYYNQIYRKARVLFVIDNCSKCLIWKKFIDRLNNNVSIKKQIKVINATILAEYGRFDNPLLKVFQDPLYKGGSADFPSLFFEGAKITGVNSKIEAEAFIRVLLHNDFIVPKENPFMSNLQDCRFEKRGLFGKEILICNDSGEEE